MSAANSEKAEDRKAKKVCLPPIADYSDEVTDEQFDRIKHLVPESEYEDAEVIGGPAW